MEFDILLKMMAKNDGSDMFIACGAPPCIKINGRLTPASKSPLTPEQSKSIAYRLMTPAQREEFEKTHECNFAISREEIGRFRVNVYMQRNSVGIVIRKIETKIPSFESLNLPPILQEVAMTKRGIVLFVGGTGSGKSTSLAAMIDYRNTNSSGHIITIEDPIEFVHQHKGCIVSQREVGIDTDSFESALVNTLRQAPDVILIGEVRHRETMEHAVAFAETGHLCLATLHANNANQALDRIINFFPEERRQQLLMDLSLNLKAVIAQRLIRKKGGNGRRAAIEILLNTPLISDLIYKGEVHQIKELMKKSAEQGMQTFDQALFHLYRDGEIDIEEALRNADSPNEVRLMVKLHESAQNPNLATDSTTRFSLQETEESAE